MSTKFVSSKNRFRKEKKKLYTLPVFCRVNAVLSLCRKRPWLRSLSSYSFHEIFWRHPCHLLCLQPCSLILCLASNHWSSSWNLHYLLHDWFHLHLQCLILESLFLSTWSQQAQFSLDLLLHYLKLLQLLRSFLNDIDCKWGCHLVKEEEMKTQNYFLK